MVTINALAEAIMDENEVTNRIYYGNQSTLVNYLNNTDDQNFYRNVSKV
jgi:hypothetical protein